MTDSSPMPSPVRRSRVAAALIVLAAACWLAMAPAAHAAKPSFSAGADELTPGFGWSVSDYVARCGTDGLVLDFSVPGGWRATANGESVSRPGSAKTFDVDPGEPVRVSFENRRTGTSSSSTVRCLPDDFPPFDFQRIRAGGPKLFMVQTAF